MPKVTNKKKKKKAKRHDPLERQIAKADEPGRLRAPKNKMEKEPQPETEEFLPERLSKKVLKQAQSQQEEEMTESTNLGRAKPSGVALSGGVDSEDEDDEALLAADLEEVEAIEISAEDERELALFMPQATSSRKTLADIIMEKIAEKEASKQQEETQAAAEESGLDPKIVQVYTDVGGYLAQYTSGKIPKPFKIIPSLKNWEHVLYLTNPDKWTCNSMYYATKLFSSGLNPKMAQRFYNLVLFPRIRSDINKNKRLNYHLYAALKKAAYKPSAMFRGIVLPLAQEECSAREAIIVASVLSKISIPAVHSAVALLKLSEMEYSGPTVLFITTLLNKKYSLPFRVIDRLTEYFSQFESDERRLPLVWHQALLAFVQRYRAQFTTKQKNQLRAVSRAQVHNAVTPEIRRELNASITTSASAPAPGTAGMDTN